MTELEPVENPPPPISLSSRSLSWAVVKPHQAGDAYRPGHGKAENVQSVVTPALTDHIKLVGDRVDVERSAHELTSRMTGMALRVRSDQAIRGTTINHVRNAGRRG